MGELGGERGMDRRGVRQGHEGHEERRGGDVEAVENRVVLLRGERGEAMGLEAGDGEDRAAEGEGQRRGGLLVVRYGLGRLLFHDVER